MPGGRRRPGSPLGALARGALPGPRAAARLRAAGAALALAGPALFGAILMVQSFHMMEHVAQMVQRYGLGFDHAHGILGHALDREVVHFAYNATLLAALLLVLLAFGIPQRWRDGRRTWMVLFAGATLFQIYHLVEHGVKMMQFFEVGINDTPGLGGQMVPVIAYHFLLNLVLYAALLAAFLGWRRERASGVLDRPAAVALRLGRSPGPGTAPRSWHALAGLLR